MTSLNIPEHIAIIMDGNGRWAKKRNLPRTAGHKEGGEALKRTIKACAKLGVKYLSVYAFSTENWKRPQEEVSFLQSLLEQALLREVKKITKQGVRLKFFGDLSAFNEDLQKKIKDAEEYSNPGRLLQLNVMLNYGSRKEILNAVNKAVKDGKTITEDDFSGMLYTKDIPDPDLIIRTSGEKRLSNFLLWQAAYSELWFTEVYWPDFNKDVLEQAIREFTSRDRKFGGLSGS